VEKKAINRESAQMAAQETRAGETVTVVESQATFRETVKRKRDID